MELVEESNAEAEKSKTIDTASGAAVGAGVAVGVLTVGGVVGAADAHDRWQDRDNNRRRQEHRGQPAGAEVVQGQPVGAQGHAI